MKRDENHIDKLFREGLGSGKSPDSFREEDWDILEQRLEARNKRRKVFFWLKTASGIAAICLLVASWWLISSVREETDVQRVHVQKDLPKATGPDDKLQAPADSRSYNKDTGVSLPAALSMKTLEPAKQVEKEKTLVALLRSPDNKSTSEISSPGSGIIPLPRIQISARATHVPFKSEILATAGSNKELTPGKKAGDLSLSIFVAPAINGVNNLRDSKMGVDAGVLLTAGLTKRWSLSTGAIYAKKIYKTGFDNYNPIYDVGFRYDPQWVDADCRVLDIPLNLNYELLSKKSNTVTLGVGVSSYLMLKESYQFVYGRPNSIDPRNYELVNENKHWLSVMNLQAAYERRLNSKIAVSVQPYMKIPLNEIGYARVKLRSFGMAVNLKWDLERLKTKKDDQNGKTDGF